MVKYQWVIMIQYPGSSIPYIYGGTHNLWTEAVEALPDTATTTDGSGMSYVDFLGNSYRLSVVDIGDHHQKF